MTKSITNPILPGFHPDPSIVRVGDDYYIANSTFEWFPGVKLSHSKDLIHWRTVGYALTRRSQLDMQGVPPSGGIWAPCLTHDGELFHLIYTNVHAAGGAYFDTPNYLVTAPSITGPWSEPIFLNTSGFDPSLFHDTDGRKWLVNMYHDHRKGKNRFAGTVLQEYSPQQQKLVGPAKVIYTGTELGAHEGPHLYKRGDYYYLMAAEGGTGFGHAEIMARSTNIWGPYETDPNAHLITSRNNPDAPLQKTGHGDFVETQSGETYFVHLCGRPIMPQKRCTLGRETAIQKCSWTDDGWLRLENGTNVGDLQTPAPDLPEHPFPARPIRDDFDNQTLDLCWNSLRLPVDDFWLSLTERPGHLRLRGRESLVSRFNQSLIARRVEAFHIEATTCLEFSPQTHHHMAGLVCYYNERNHYYLRVTHDETLGKCIGIALYDKDRYDQSLDQDIPINGCEKIFLKVTINHDQLQFAFSPDGENWQNIGPTLDATILSDEYAAPLAFTGAFVGLCVQDLAGTNLHADFDFFEYQEFK